MSKCWRFATPVLLATTNLAATSSIPTCLLEPSLPLCLPAEPIFASARRPPDPPIAPPTAPPTADSQTDRPADRRPNGPMAQRPARRSDGRPHRQAPRAGGRAVEIEAEAHALLHLHVADGDTVGEDPQLRRRGENLQVLPPDADGDEALAFGTWWGPTLHKLGRRWCPTLRSTPDRPEIGH